MKQADYAKTLEWLKSGPPLEAMRARFPEEWDAVQGEIAAIVEGGRAEELKSYLEQLSAAHQPAQDKRAALSHFVRSRMAHESVKKLCLSTLAVKAGAQDGKLRFNWFNGFIAQRLLFARGLERKPVSLPWFRLLWPLVWQRQRLMPLVQPRGIYCFYSRELVAALAELIGARRCLEIGAGDGTLSRFLKECGVNVTATDNHAWSHAVQYPEWVHKQEAREALAAHAPEAVICSWPPARNDFERQVFATPSVQLYIVIGSRHAFAFGNWDDYRKQSGFDMEEDERLGAQVLPPEMESAVYVFRRKAANGGDT